MHPGARGNPNAVNDGGYHFKDLDDSSNRIQFTTPVEVETSQVTRKEGERGVPSIGMKLLSGLGP